MAAERVVDVVHRHASAHVPDFCPLNFSDVNRARAVVNITLTQRSTAEGTYTVLKL